MGRWWVYGGEVEHGGEIGRGKASLVFLLCGSERGPARVDVDGFVSCGLVVESPSFLVDRGDHLATNTTKQTRGKFAATSAASAMSLWLPRSRRHIPLRALSYHLLARAPPVRRPHLRLVRYESTNAQDPKPTPPTPKEDAPLISRAWKTVKHEAQHYWHGSKLLVSEVRISARLQWKILHGESLTRRERRQVCLCASSWHSSDWPMY